MQASSSSGTAPAARVLALEGGCNFRDLGGYTTVDGARLRTGRLFRSGVLAYLTPTDQARLGALGVRTIVDLRRRDEREQEPTRWPDRLVRVLSRDDPGDRSALQGLDGGQPRTAEDMRAAMSALYRGMPAWLGGRLTVLFRALAAGSLPLVFHCSAGKDRTGFAAALVLALLGVPRSTIVADYALTNQAVDFEAFLEAQRASRLGLSGSGHPLLTLEPEARQAMFRADTEYLESAMQAISEEYGSIETYLRVALGVDAAQRERIREQLLE